MRAQALSELKLHAQPDAKPVLTPQDLDAILDSTMPPLVKLASIWTPNTIIEFGQVIAPTVRNGHWYRCIVHGTTDPATEPLWPTSRDATRSEGPVNSDFSMLTWQEAGPDAANLYDVRIAIYKAWMMKSSKASQNFSVTLGAHSFSRQQVYDHCVAKAMEFAPLNFY